MNRMTVTVPLAIAVGAAALPITTVGIGWPIAALAVLAVAWSARATRAGQPQSTDQPGGGDRGVDRGWRVAAGVAALALAAVPALRASMVLAVLCLAAAAMLGSYALAGGRTWRGVAAGAFAAVPGLFRGLHLAV